ncbi:MAG TPA: hypothetical protein V6C58_08695, partial [Allocoleopsis sp.]
IPLEIAKSFTNKASSNENIIYKNLTDHELILANNYFKNKYSNKEFIHHGDKEEGICLISLEWTKDNDKK